MDMIIKKFANKAEFTRHVACERYKAKQNGNVLEYVAAENVGEDEEVVAIMRIRRNNTTRKPLRFLHNRHQHVG